MFILTSISNDCWERLNETSLPDKKDFSSELTLEDICDKGYEHSQKVFREFCTDMDDYHDLYDETDPLMLTDACENFINTLTERIGLYPSHFYFASGSAWQACLKKTVVKLELLTD